MIHHRTKHYQYDFEQMKCYISTVYDKNKLVEEQLCVHCNMLCVSDLPLNDELQDAYFDYLFLIASKQNE